MPKKLKSAAIEVISPIRKKTVPRTAYKVGERTPHQFQPGTSGNPSGRAKDDTLLLSRGLRATLPCRAPAAFCKAVGLPPTSSWSQVITQSLLRNAAAGDVAAIREIREFTEGSRVANRFEFAETQDDRPLIHIHFVESDGDGRLPAGYSGDDEPTIDR